MQTGAPAPRYVRANLAIAMLPRDDISRPTETTYKPEDHAEIAGIVAHLKQPWFLSYDDAAEIRTLYQGFRSVAYGIAYSAQTRARGKEVAFFSDGLVVPAVEDPTRVTPKGISRYEVA
jgi:hypothetical protein